MKRCSMCKEDKDKNLFYINNNSKDGLAYRCTPCHKLHYGSKEYLKKGYESTGWARHLRNKYGITEDIYNEMLARQEGKCKICVSEGTRNKYSKRLYVDHCHDTGKIRGLLCDYCNVGLGRFEDNIDRIKSAIRYLENES